MCSSHPNVLVAAEATLYRTGLVALLHQQWPNLIITLTADTRRLVDLVRERPFQLLIVDSNSLECSATTLLHHIHQTRPSQRILLLTNDQQQKISHPHSLIPRHITPNFLTVALASLLDSTPCKVLNNASSIPTPFSRRELEVLRLVVDDLCNQEIADYLYLSIRTVESHRRALLQKSGTRTLAGLVAWALRAGMVI